MFSEFEKPGGFEPELKKAADVAVGEVLQIRKDEKVLIVSNPIGDVAHISMALYDFVLEYGGRPVLAYQERKTQLDFAEPGILGALRAIPDVLMLISDSKLGKDRQGIEKPYTAGGKSFDHIFRCLLWGSRQLRSFWSPGTTMDMFCRTLPIDYARLKKESSSVKRVLDGAASVRIRTEMGTDLEIGLRNRSAMTDDGNFNKPGKGGNLPAGETFISPELGSSNGKIVIDGCIAIRGGVVVIETPVELEVEGGFVTGIKGEREADRLRETIAEAEENARRFEKEGMLTEGKGEIYAKNARNLGELGIGLNHKARITGNMLEDEKVYGTCHIAVGHNYDEDAPSLIHLDGVIKKPGIIAFTEDGTPVELMEEGLLLV